MHELLQNMPYISDKILILQKNASINVKIER